MSEMKLTAERRTAFGKGAARRIRRDHKIPAVLYGHGTRSGAHHLARPRHDDGAQDRATPCCPSSSTARASSPWPRTCSATRSSRSSSMSTWSSSAAARRSPSTSPCTPRARPAPTPSSRSTRRPCSCWSTPPASPESITVSVEGLPAGTQIHASDVVLPEGAELVSDPETLVVNVTATISEEALEAELGEAAPAAEAEAAPAAPSEAPAGTEAPAEASRRVARAPPCRRGSSSGSATPGPGMPERATTSGPSWCCELARRYAGGSGAGPASEAPVTHDEHRVPASSQDPRPRCPGSPRHPARRRPGARGGARRADGIHERVRRAGAGAAGLLRAVPGASRRRPRRDGHRRRRPSDSSEAVAREDITACARSAPPWGRGTT